MDEEQTRVQADVADALGRGGRAKVRLDALTPLQRELVADWIESKFSRLSLRIAQGEHYLKSHPEDDAMQRQIYYWRVAVAVSRQLAYYARVHRAERKQTGSEQPT